MLTKSVFSLTIILCMTIAGTAAVSYAMLQSGVFDIVNVAVVIPEDQNESQMVAQYISGMESVSAVCDFKYMDEQSAQKALLSNEVQAVISLPESFYDDINSVQKASVYLYFPQKSSLNTKIFRELLGDGIHLLQAAEAGVFAATDTAQLYKSSMEKYEIATLISFIYMKSMMQRDDMFVSTVFSSLGEMTLFQYYYTAIMVIFLTMSGINFSFLYKKESRAVSQKLLLTGIGPVSQTLVKLLSMTGILWIPAAFIYFISCIIASYTESNILDFRISVFAMLLFLCLGISAYFHLFYTLSGQGIQSNVLLLCVNVLMIICSGILIPSDYLPAAIQAVSKWLPLNFFDNFCADILFNNPDPIRWISMTVWIILAGSIGAILIYRKRGV